ncbi:hypothetical protein PENDEC_c001G07228 [Penicillium decumbens]|uniref:Chromo domain-containing protein n=1 Tax=Penicillium decumbens TaxID=69771 RepID=A0A1V6PN69_PENDC|nr:hypothetical protein PENDEC_c001G07228 [Penicillium decumbens]
MTMKRHYDAKHKPVHFKRYVGRFKVLERIGRLAYKLDLPESWRIHPVISIAHLEPAPSGDDPWNRQSDTVHTPTDDHRFPGETRYDVEAILAKRVRPARGRAPANGPRKMVTQYLIRWTGQSAKEDRWITAADAVGCEELIREFEERQVSL